MGTSKLALGEGPVEVNPRRAKQFFAGVRGIAGRRDDERERGIPFWAAATVAKR